MKLNGKPTGPLITITPWMVMLVFAFLITLKGL